VNARTSAGETLRIFNIAMAKDHLVVSHAECTWPLNCLQVLGPLAL
jgi:hypothetical protein